MGYFHMFGAVDRLRVSVSQSSTKLPIRNHRILTWPTVSKAESAVRMTGPRKVQRMKLMVINILATHRIICLRKYYYFWVDSGDKQVRDHRQCRILTRSNLSCGPHRRV